MKIKELMELSEALKDLGRKELAFDAALIIAENLNTIHVPVEVAEKKRRGIIQKYLLCDESGKPVKAFEGAYKLTDPNACSKELEELMENEIEIGAIHPIPREALTGISIAPAQLEPILRYIG